VETSHSSQYVVEYTGSRSHGYTHTPPLVGIPPLPTPSPNINFDCTIEPVA